MSPIDWFRGEEAVTAQIPAAMEFWANSHNLANENECNGNHIFEIDTDYMADDLEEGKHWFVVSVAWSMAGKIII